MPGLKANPAGWTVICVWISNGVDVVAGCGKMVGCVWGWNTVWVWTGGREWTVCWAGTGWAGCKGACIAVFSTAAAVGASQEQNIQYPQNGTIWNSHIVSYFHAFNSLGLTHLLKARNRLFAFQHYYNRLRHKIHKCSIFGWCQHVKASVCHFHPYSCLLLQAAASSMGTRADQCTKGGLWVAVTTIWTMRRCIHRLLCELAPSGNLLQSGAYYLCVPFF